jgi:chemotaxis protein methyltransferase CheR
MMLDQRGWFDRAAVEIMASDGSPAAIAKARAGLYGQRSFRNLAPDLHTRYFAPSGDGKWTVDPSLQRRVSYDVVNLMDADAVAGHASVPIIFCRNVFIYFSERSIRRAVDAFSSAMPDPGFLCVGASESLLRLATRFELKEIGGAFVYVKPEATARRSLAVSFRSERN